MKIFFRRIHLYLSLAAGLVILVACATGAILVFEKDLMTAFHKERYYVKEEASALSLDQLSQKVKDSFPGSKINGVKVYSEKERSVEFNVGFPSNKGKGQQPERPSNYTVFVNPYTGEILEK